MGHTMWTSYFWGYTGPWGCNEWTWVDQDDVDGPRERLWDGDVTSMTLETLDYELASLYLTASLGLLRRWQPWQQFSIQFKDEVRQVLGNVFRHKT